MEEMQLAGEYTVFCGSSGSALFAELCGIPCRFFGHFCTQATQNKAEAWF